MKAGELIASYLNEGIKIGYKLDDDSLLELKPGTVLKLFLVSGFRLVVLLWKSQAIGTWAYIDESKYKGSPELHIHDRRVNTIDQWDLLEYEPVVVSLP